MFNNKITYNKPYSFQKSITLNKIKTSYDKLEKEMQKPPSDYDSIKTLIETQNNNITNIQNNINKKSKIDIQMTLGRASRAFATTHSKNKKK